MVYLCQDSSVRRFIVSARLPQISLSPKKDTSAKPTNRCANGYFPRPWPRYASPAHLLSPAVASFPSLRLSSSPDITPSVSPPPPLGEFRFATEPEQRIPWCCAVAAVAAPRRLRRR